MLNYCNTINNLEKRSLQLHAITYRGDIHQGILILKSSHGMNFQKFDVSRISFCALRYVLKLLAHPRLKLVSIRRKLQALEKQRIFTLRLQFTSNGNQPLLLIIFLKLMNEHSVCVETQRSDFLADAIPKHRVAISRLFQRFELIFKESLRKQKSYF